MSATTCKPAAVRPIPTPPELREQISEALFAALETAGLAELLRGKTGDLPLEPVEACGLHALADALYERADGLQQMLTQIHRSTETKD